jgi:hypothetical protein
MNIVLYTKATGAIVDIFPEDATFGGLNNDLSYDLYEVPEGATSINECTVIPRKTKVDIIKSIFRTIESDPEQITKLMGVLNKYPVFITCLDTENWELARAQMGVALQAGDITQDEYNMIDERIPTA